jgi:hypothetical protein
MQELLAAEWNTDCPVTTGSYLKGLAPQDGSSLRQGSKLEGLREAKNAFKMFQSTNGHRISNDLGVAVFVPFGHHGK